MSGEGRAGVDTPNSSSRVEDRPPLAALDPPSGRVKSKTHCFSGTGLANGSGANATDPLMHALARHRAIIRTQQEYVFAASATGAHHAFTQTKLHFPRLQIGHAHDQPANQSFRIIRRLDSGEYVSCFTAAE